MRGTPHGYRGIGHRFGIIPADAGNTVVPGCGGNPWQHHPRGCGEHLRGWIPREALPGSSPRMRGTRRYADGFITQQGIIPADVGNTAVKAFVDEVSEDHPRGCGEHMTNHTPVCSKAGSSPRMRGTLFDCIKQVVKVRIIPADAGNTWFSCLRMSSM